MRWMDVVIGVGKAFTSVHLSLLRLRELLYGMRGGVSFDHWIPAAVMTSFSDLIVVPSTCSRPPNLAHAAMSVGSCDSTRTSSRTRTSVSLYLRIWSEAGSVPPCPAGPAAAVSRWIPTAAANRSRKPKGEMSKKADLFGSGEMMDSSVRSSAIMAASVM